MDNISNFEHTLIVIALNTGCLFNLNTMRLSYENHKFYNTILIPLLENKKTEALCIYNRAYKMSGGLSQILFHSGSDCFNR